MVGETSLHDNPAYTLAKVSWREIKSDNKGSRFVPGEVETLPARFLLEAMEYGMHLDPPEDFKTRPLLSRNEQWRMNVEIVILNYFGKDEGDEDLSKMLSHEQIGKIDPERQVSKERVRQIIKETLRLMHSNSPDYLQHKYPLHGLLEQTDRPAFMVMRKGITRAIAARVIQKATYDSLRTEGFSVQGLSDARRILPEYGLEVPRNPSIGKYRQLMVDLQALSQNDPFDKKQHVLDRIDRYALDHHRAELKPHYCSVSDIARQAGLTVVRQSGEYNLILQVLSERVVNTRSIASEVKSGNQMGIWYSHIILALDKEQALKVLQSDPRLDSLRRQAVVQITGERVDKLPTTTHLPGQDYKIVAGLLRQLGLRSSGTGFSMLQILEGCPVPVFKYEGMHFYPSNMEDPLLEFLKNSKVIQ